MKICLGGCLALALIVFSSAVQAADMAEYDVLGYSEDGRYFAFEQFGVQDGSGFAYSGIFVLDFERDAWVAGSPVRQQADDETVGLAQLRRQNVTSAYQLLEELSIDLPARTLAATTPMEQGEQEIQITFNPRAILTPIDPLVTIRLEQFGLASPRDCLDMVQTQGFALFVGQNGGGESQVHRDTRLPSSRFCPASYGLAAILAPFDGVDGRAVALISVYQLGFEGLDRRFLAVPFDLPF